MTYGPKEIEKWRKIQKSKDGLGLLERLLKAGKIYHVYRLSRLGRRSDD